MDFVDQNGFRVFARVFWLLRVTALIKFTQTLERDTKDKFEFRLVLFDFAEILT